MPSRAAAFSPSAPSGTQRIRSLKMGRPSAPRKPVVSGMTTSKSTRRTSIRVSARSSAVDPISGGSGWRSSRYSQMATLSDTRVSPFTSSNGV